MGLGMAIALTVSHLFLGVSYRYFAKKLMPDIRVLKYVPHLLFGGAAAAVGWFLYGRWVAGQSWWVLVLLAVAFFPAIFGTMTVLGFARRRDWSELISILDYRMLWQYVHGELVKGRGLPKGGSRPSRGPT